MKNKPSIEKGIGTPSPSVSNKTCLIKLLLNWASSPDEVSPLVRKRPSPLKSLGQNASELISHAKLSCGGGESQQSVVGGTKGNPGFLSLLKARYPEDVLPPDAKGCCLFSAVFSFILPLSVKHVP